MSGFQTITEDMKTASNAATQAAERARKHSSSKAVKAAGEALKGSDAYWYLPELGSSWDKKISDWAEETESFGTAIAGVSADHQRADGDALVRVGRLGGALGVK